MERTNESFNGKFRDECPAMDWTRIRIEAKIVIDDWKSPVQRSATAFEFERRHAASLSPAIYLQPLLLETSSFRKPERS